MPEEQEAGAGAGSRNLEHLKPASFLDWGELDADWRALFRAYVGTGLYERSVLDARERELCAVAALTVLNFQGKLERHLLNALEAGVPREKLQEVILQMSVFGGFPATITGLNTLRGLLERVDGAG